MVFEVVLLCRSENIPISGTLLKAKARMIANQLNIENFTASNGWLERFKKRYNISFGERSCSLQEDREPSQKIQKFIDEKIEDSQPMFWACSQPGEICEYLDETEAPDTLRLLKTEDQSAEFHDIDTMLSTMLISCSINFETIDSPYFKKFVHALNPKYLLPSSKRLKKKVISKLENDGGAVDY